MESIRINVFTYIKRIFARKLLHRQDRKQKYMIKFLKHMALIASDSPSPIPTSLRLGFSVETPPRPVPAGPLWALFHDPSSPNILEAHPERTVSFSRRVGERRHAVGSHSAFTTCCWLPLRLCTVPLSCSLQFLLTLSLWSLGLCLLQFVSTACHHNFNESRKTDLVCILSSFSSAFAFLILLVEMDIRVESLFAICSSLPQRFHYYFSFVWFLGSTRYIGFN